MKSWNQVGLTPQDKRNARLAMYGKFDRCSLLEVSNNPLQMEDPDPTLWDMALFIEGKQCLGDLLQDRLFAGMMQESTK